MLPLETLKEGSYCIISRITARDPRNVCSLAYDPALMPEQYCIVNGTGSVRPCFRVC